MGDDDLDDSVFLSNNNHKPLPAPDLSPLLTPTKSKAKKTISKKNTPLSESKEPVEVVSMDISNPLVNLQHQHHDRYFHFCEVEPSPKATITIAPVKKEPEIDLKSPNLSPIRQASTSSGTSSVIKSSKGGGSSLKKSSTKIKTNVSNLDESFSSTSSSNSDGRTMSIIFTDLANGEEKRKHTGTFRKHDHDPHENKREEIYTKELFHDIKGCSSNNEDDIDDNELINDTFQNNLKNSQSMMNSQEINGKRDFSISS